MINATKQSVTRGKQFMRALADGVVLEGEISPSVFIYRGYPLQLTVTLRTKQQINGGTAYAVNMSLTAQSVTDQDAVLLLEAVRIIPCGRCGQTAFDPTSVETNRRGLCEDCFLAELDAEFQQEHEMELLRLAEMDCQMKAHGMRFRVSAWVHDDAGDDYQVDWYFKAQPRHSRIRRLLMLEGSEVLDDFEIMKL